MTKPRENLHQLLMEHNACEWLDRVQDYFSQMSADYDKAVAALREIAMSQFECLGCSAREDAAAVLKDLGELPE